MSPPQGCPQARRPAPVAARWLRAIRRSRTLSQRELAALAQVPLSTVSAIESGRRSPGVALFERILTATGHRLAVVDLGGEPRPLSVDDAHDARRDRAGRRLPAHLSWGGKPSLADGPYWWGFHRVAWYDERDPAIPDQVFWHRPREARGPLREHPWFGPFRGRNACHGPADEPCHDCVGTCRFGD